jgi:hypothetical protein
MHRESYVLFLLLLVGSLVAYVVWDRPQSGPPLLAGVGIVTLLLAIWDRSRE